MIIANIYFRSGVRQNPLFPNQSRIAVVMIFECFASKIPPTMFDFRDPYPRPHGRGYQCFAPQGLSLVMDMDFVLLFCLVCGSNPSSSSL